MRTILALALAVTIPSVSAVRCSDFSDQEEAQRYHDEHGGNTSLDRYKDGEACECLPGGSAYGNPVCNS
jgi:excalibur calcium-binding domain